MTNFIKKLKNKESGAVLIFSILLIGIILSIGLALSTIFSNKLRSSVDAKSSVPAYYAADSGIEWILFTKAKNPAYAMPGFGIDSSFEVTEDTGGKVRVLGTFRGVSRAIEVDFGGFASGGPAGPTPTPPPGVINYYTGWQRLNGQWASCNVVNTSPICVHNTFCDHPSTPTCGTYSNGQTTLWWLNGYNQNALFITCNVSTSPLSCP